MKKINKPWGYEIIWTQLGRGAFPAYGFVGKMLHIKKGHRLSLQYHQEKSEAILVLKGTLNLYHNEQWGRVKPMDSRLIHSGQIHRMSAPWGPVSLVEVSTPQLDDLIRLEDDYGRKT